MLFVVDARIGVTPGDEELAQILRESHKPVLVIANKIDDPSQEPLAHEFHRLGFGEPFPVSGFTPPCRLPETRSRRQCERVLAAKRAARVDAAIFPRPPGGPSIRMRSLARAILEVYRPDLGARLPPREEVLLNFSGDRYTFPIVHAREFLREPVKREPEGGQPAPPEWQRRGLLKDKIVLIGGAFRAARDEYVTPVGVPPPISWTPG